MLSENNNFNKADENNKIDVSNINDKNNKENVEINKKNVKNEKVVNKEKVNKKIKNTKKGKSKLQETFIKYSLPTYIVIGIALFLLSMMLAAQVKSISNTEEVLEGKREAQLADDLVNLQKKYNDLKEKYEESEEIVNEYQTSASTNDTLISSMKQEVEDLSIMAGTTDLKGEGIIITLTDGVKSTGVEVNSDTLVHDSDVLTVVNELKAAGAEAISVNGQRIIATSAIRCVGPVIQVNYQKVAAPFEIKAIGDAQYLESAMNIKNGIVDTLKELGIGVTVSRETEVKIPKYEGVLTFEHAVEDK